MSDELSEAARKFLEYRDRLFADYPKARAEVEKVVHELVDCRTAPAEKIWKVLWDKPLFSNRDTAVAERMKSDAARFMRGAWKTARMKGPFSIDEKPASRRTGIHRTKNKYYFRIGSAVRELQRKNGISYYRSFAIMSAGKHLRELRSTSARPFAYLHDKDLSEIVPKLKKELGKGWGNITVLHFLTDLGLACKPDLHVVRTMHALGLRSCTRSQASYEDAIIINQKVSELLPLAYGSKSPEDLRRFDKTLMEISSKRLLPEETYVRYPDRKSRRKKSERREA